MTKPKPQVTAVPLSTTTKKQRAEVRGLQDQLAISQASSAKRISLLRQQLTAQSQAFTAERYEMRTFMTNLMRQQRGSRWSRSRCAQNHCMFYVLLTWLTMTPCSLNFSTWQEILRVSWTSLWKRQVAMAPQLPTNVPHPTALPRKEAVAKPKETVTSQCDDQSGA